MRIENIAAHFNKMYKKYKGLSPSLTRQLN